MFFNVNANVSNWNSTSTQCSLVFQENPLNEFVELPEKYKGLLYSNILCGVIRGCLDQVLMKTEVEYVKCPLMGSDVSEIRITLKENEKEKAPKEDEN